MQICNWPAGSQESRFTRKQHPETESMWELLEAEPALTSYFKLFQVCNLQLWIGVEAGAPDTKWNPDCRAYFLDDMPESVWAKGSSNSGGLSNIFTSSHLHITSSNVHIFSSSHPHIFTSPHLQIFSSPHLLIFTQSSHPLIFTSSHLLIFTSARLHIFSCSHPHIFTSSHLLIFSSSHLLTFTSAYLLIFTSSHLRIFTSSHLTFSLALLISCPLALLPSCSLALLLSCPLALLPSCSLLLFYFSLKARGSANETARNATLSHETRLTRFDRQKLK